MKNIFKNPWAKDGALFTDWAEEFNSSILIKDKASHLGCSTGAIILSGFKKEDFKEIRIIPEEGQPYQPSNDGTFYGDGFYFQKFSDSQYWYKVSGGSSVHVKHSGTAIHITPIVSNLCKLAAKVLRKTYVVGWEPKSRKHWTANPFDK
jgi:hypothetical protein